MPELIAAEPGSPDWLAARRTGVTATNIATILGLSSRDSMYSLFWRKMGQIPEIPDNDRFHLGHYLEPYVAECWQLEHLTTWMLPGGLYRHDKRSWQLATTDRHIAEAGAQQIVTGVLELKSWADADRHSWDSGPPVMVRAQVLWQMDVMDVAVGHVGVVFLPSGEFRSYIIEHDGAMDCAQLEHVTDAGVCEVCKDLELMRAAGEEFMARLRLELPPPDPDSSAATLAAVRARFTRQPDKQADVDAGTWISYLTVKDLIRDHETDARTLEIALREQAGEAQVLCVDGEPVARRIISDAQVKAHVRHQDYLRRIKQGDDDDQS